MRFLPTSSIYWRLIALIAGLMTLMVSALAAHFWSRQMASYHQRLLAKADTYDALVSGHLESAIAFRDRETAREVLSSLAVDPDVRSAALYTGDGNQLYALGAPAPALRQAALRAAARQVIDDRDRLVVMRPVVSPEGPRGRLLIELSTRRLHEASRRVALTSAGVGSLVLAFGVLSAWFIARSLARRLRRIAGVLTSVAAGNLQHDPISDDSADEIGALARASNAMLCQLRQLIDGMQALARREQESLAEANRTLELRVEERTRELRAANEQLRQEMEERGKIELELRHAHKLESVGRLAAGIAHEINTPIQFVGNNISYLETSFADLLQLCAVYRLLCERAASTPLGPEGVAEAREAEITADLEFMRENVPRSIAATQDGIGRVARIVQSMKIFAHRDRGERIAADLNAALRSTLTVASNELKYIAEVQTELGELPPVPCFLSDLNQVFLNLLVNAAHAIADVVGQSGAKGIIRVKTALEGDRVVISISDSGTGIPEAIRGKIFDPFFTTKDVGRGTGQGLALARSVIVEKHRGTLTFDTEMGQGTTFHIGLPLCPEAAVSAGLALTGSGAQRRGGDGHP
jgi:signal transduction histidine kinase